MLKEILEFTSDPLREANVNDELKIIHGISLMNGKISKNGWTYTEEAFEDIAKRSEGIPVYWDHFSDEDQKSRQGVRSVRAIAGKIEGARRDNGQIKGDLHATEQAYPILKELVRLDLRGVGMSYNLQGKSIMDKSGNETIVSVPKVRSSDIVSQAALNSSFFEAYTGQNTSSGEGVLSGTVQQITEDRALIEKDGFISEINLSEFEATPSIGDSVEFIIEDRMESKKEGIIADQMVQDEIRRKADDLLWKAKSMISKVLTSKEIEKFTEKKKEINLILDDLEAELSKILPKIKPDENEEEVESMPLSDSAIKGLESIGREAEKKEERESILEAARFGAYAERVDDPIVKKENERLKKAERDREAREAKAINVSESDKAEILASIGKI